MCQYENGGCERPFFCGIRSRCGCHRSESHPATILTYLGTICTWEYLDYPYYPFVSLMSFGSMICVSSLRVWLTYQVANKARFACAPNRTSIRTVFWFVCSTIDVISGWIFTVFVFSLFLLFSSRSFSPSFCECRCVYAL